MGANLGTINSLYIVLSTHSCDETTALGAQHVADIPMRSIVILYVFCDTPYRPIAFQPGIPCLQTIF